MDWLTRLWHMVIYTTADGQGIQVSHFVLVLAMLLIGYYLSRFVGFLIGRQIAATRLGPDAAFAIQRVLFIVLIELVAASALAVLGIPLTAFAFATGAIAIGVGFGAQNIINNFISGWILLAERQVRIGDTVEVADVVGTVELIGTRSTRVRRLDGVRVLIPNGQMLEHPVATWNLADRSVRSKVVVGVAYGSPLRLVEQLLESAAREHPAVLKAQPVRVVFEEFGDNALVFELLFWCDAGGERELRMIRSDIRFRIAELLAENDIVIAFPQREVHLDTLAPLDVRLVPAAAPALSGGDS